MTDEQNAVQDAQPQEPAQAPGIRILAQYIRDLSFENPNAPDSLRSDGGAPKIGLDVELGARARQDGLNEVELKLSVTATREDMTVFHCEIMMGGLFQVEGVPAEEMEAILLVECPRYLFPFARRIVADLTGESGFPPFRMDPIDFAAIYMARRQQVEAGGAEQA